MRVCRFILMLISFAMIALNLSCNDNAIYQDNESDFYIAVYDDDGNPLEGVIVQVDFGHDYYAYSTDNNGKALLPAYAYGHRATFRKNHFFTLSVEEVQPDDYVLAPTPYILTEIGDVIGKAVRFESNRIITVHWTGDYRVYNYDESGVTEEALITFPPSSYYHKSEGDTLWFSTDDGSIYAYNLADPYSPSELLRLEIDNNTLIFAHRDSLIAVGHSYPNLASLRIFSYHLDNTVVELDRIESLMLRQILFRSAYLITLSFAHNFYTVFDVSDPSDIRLAYIDYFREPENSFMKGDTLGLVYEYGSGVYLHQLIELSDPLNPTIVAGFLADGKIYNILDDTLATGKYSDDYGSQCVFKGNFESFRAIAVLSEGYNGHRGSRPPYFIIGDKLWKLEER